MVHSRSILGVLTAMLASGVVLAGSVTSGPPVGEKVPGPFAPLNVTGPDAGTKTCQYCKNKSHPVAVVFCKEVTPAVVQLLKKIDTATAVNAERGLRSYAVVCSDAPGLDKQLQDVAQQVQIRQTILTLYKAGGPEKYHLNPEADVTVLLYNQYTVKANHAFKAGELTEPAIDAIIADVGKMLSEN